MSSLLRRSEDTLACSGIPLLKDHLEQTSVCQASANVNGVWVCKSQEGGVTGPSHPIMGKQAFVTLSTLGRLRLTFSKVDNTWVELDSTLDIPDTSGNCLSHATFVTDGEPY